MALEARIAEINEECSRLIKEQITRLENERDSLIAAARKEFENASIEKIRKLIKDEDFSNEIIPEVTRNTAAMLLQYHDVELVKSSLLALYPENKKKPRKEKKPSFATIAASTTADTTVVEPFQEVKKPTFAEIAASTTVDTTVVEPFQEVKKKLRTITKLPKFDPEIVPKPTVITATVRCRSFLVKVGNREYVVTGRPRGKDGISYLINEGYSIRGVSTDELSRALLDTNPNNFVWVIRNRGVRGLVDEKLMYALLCSVLQYFVEKDVIKPGNDSVDSSFSVKIEKNHNVTLQYGENTYAIDDVCDLDHINYDIKGRLEGDFKYKMDEATMSALTAFIHRWANYCAIDYGFDKSN